MLRLLGATWDPAQSRIRAFVKDNGLVRVVVLTWHQAADFSPPPVNWWELVCAEVESRKAEEEALKRNPLRGL